MNMWHNKCVRGILKNTSNFIVLINTSKYPFVEPPSQDIFLIIKKKKRIFTRYPLFLPDTHFYTPQYLQYPDFIFDNLKTSFMNEHNKILVNKVKPL
jgi:hypothetical protein